MKNINWTQSILTAVITIVVSVVAGMILYHLQFRDPELTYETEQILPFNSIDQNVNIYHITIKNTGKKLAEDIKLEVQVAPAKIESYNVSSDFPLDLTKKQDSISIRISGESLNENEFFKLSILASSDSKFKEEPLVKLRAKGVTGTKKETKESDEDELPFGKWALLLVPMFVSSLTLVTRSFIKTQRIGDKHEDDQDKILGYLYGIHNLPDQVDRILSLPNTPSYWSESDRITSIAINSNNTVFLQKSKSVLLNLLDYAKIADSSKGIIYFNLAKIETALGNDGSEFLDKARKEVSQLVETRLKIDPTFKQEE